MAKLDANQHLTTYEYDARNQRVVELQHLANGQTLPPRSAVIPYANHNTAFTSGTLRTQWTYDGNGQLEDEVDAKGQLTHHEYGVLKRLERVVYSRHVAPRALPSMDSVTYAYRGEGELERCDERKTAADGGTVGPVVEVTRHAYDSLERRRETVRYDGYVTTFEYDTKGNRTLVRDGTLVETRYTYDSNDRLKTATTPMGTATYEYYGDGLLWTTTYSAPTTLEERRDYDASGRLVALRTMQGATLLRRFGYTYDANGNRVQQNETAGGLVEVTEYGYDTADRLIGMHEPGQTVLYELDAVGNRTGEKRVSRGVVTALTVAAFAALSPAQASGALARQHNAVDWVVSVDDVKAGTSTRLEYDANGNRVREGAREYRWDIRDTLTQVVEGGSVVGTYDYDAKLQRVKADTGAGRVEYVLDGTYVLRETGARSRRYHYGEGEALGVSGSGGADRWLLIDGLGSVSTEVPVAGAPVVRQYDAWGNYRNGTAPTANEARLGYTGHQFDVETGLTYARARYYDSKLGVFLSRDEFEGILLDAPSLHRFAYAHNSPLRYRDPSGRAPAKPGYTFVPLTTEYLRDIVIARKGMPKNENSLRQLTGAVFEDAAIRSMGGAKNKVAFPSDKRVEVTGGNKERVVPDVTLEAHRIPAESSVSPDAVRNKDFVKLFGANAGVRRFSDSVFVDIKASQNISLSTEEHQATGYIDVLSRSPAARARSSGHLIYVTAGDTEVSPSLVKAATEKRVVVHQARVMVEVPVKVSTGPDGVKTAAPDLVVVPGMNPRIHIETDRILNPEASRDAWTAPRPETDPVPLFPESEEPVKVSK